MTSGPSFQLVPKQMQTGRFPEVIVPFSARQPRMHPPHDRVEIQPVDAMAAYHLVPVRVQPSGQEPGLDEVSTWRI